MKNELFEYKLFEIVPLNTKKVSWRALLHMRRAAI